METAFYLLSLVLTSSQKPPAAASTPQYLCVAESLAGFAYNKATKDWEGTTFRTDTKYLVAPARSSPNTYQLTRVGESWPLGSCKDNFNEDGFLFCNTLAGDLRFNRNNGRFLLAYVFGYYNVQPNPRDAKNPFIVKNDDDSDTPFIEIGKCSPL